MKCFSIDVMIGATAYILAENEEEARKKADAMQGEFLEFSSSRQILGSTRTANDIYMTGEAYNREMPEVSLSPAMTVHTPDHRTLDLVEDFDVYKCEGCGRDEADCSADPCADVIADREDSDA